MAKADWYAAHCGEKFKLLGEERAAKIIGIVDRWAVMRYPGAMPFLVPVSQLRHGQQWIPVQEQKPQHLADADNT